jgi:hypothetical protein
MSNNNIDTTAAEITTAEITPVTTSVEVTEWAYITGWMKSEVATDLIAQYVAEGTYTKKQIKKCSPRFANKKDKTDGYEVRIIAVSGIHPELEQAVVGYRAQIEKKAKIDTTQLRAWKSLLKIENIALNEDGQLKITDKCIWMADGSRIQLVVKK